MSIETRHRIQAIEVLDAYLQTRDFPDRMIEQASGNKALLMELVYGAVRWLRALKWVKNRFVKKDPGTQLEAVLYLAFYQLLYQEGAAEYAVVNESVQAAKELTNRGGANLVNAVLRNLLREKEDVLQALALEPPAIRNSHPDVLYGRWVRTFGEEAALELMQWNNGRASTVVRVVTSRIAPDAFMQRLAGNGIDGYRQIEGASEFIELPYGVRVFDVPGFEEGDFLVQDPSTAMAVTLLDARPGELVLDACAAPGGKALCIAQAMNNSGRLVALDLHADRMTRLNENIQRLGLRCITPVKGDARKVDLATLSPDGRLFDRILLDVPCSNTGVIRRRPDSRWRFSDGRQERLTQTQREILDHAAELLHVGGTLVYSTCSLEEEENTRQVTTFLKRHADFTLEKEDRRFPPADGMDGAYAVRLAKN
ncbi:MAG: 16S rRNA (cytosine(967)-C(5))-methyltransferase RsmB [Spartobacteria bacterium]|nr:16S rRNA (cytosine(967)-C(5))-methyltransferase RsmB [Spartobacteria bacterium]